MPLLETRMSYVFEMNAFSDSHVSLFNIQDSPENMCDDNERSNRVTARLPT
jgi:hypothetical protein